MEITYNRKNDLLYLRLDQRKQDVINKQVNDNVVLDIGDDDKIIGIEILDASKTLNLEKLRPISYKEIPVRE